MKEETNKSVQEKINKYEKEFENTCKSIQKELKKHQNEKKEK